MNKTFLEIILFQIKEQMKQIRTMMIFIYFVFHIETHELRILFDNILLFIIE